MKAENSYLLKLAWKNIQRNAGRSFFIGLSVALSVGIAVWIMSFFDGMNHQIEVAVVKGNVGYYQLQEYAYSQTTEPTSPLAFDEQTRKTVEHTGVRAYSPELVLDAYLSAPEGSAAFQLVGVDFDRHAQAMGLDQAITAGAWPARGNPGVVIGQDIADKFHYVVGDQIVLNFQDAKGELKNELLPIVGIYRANGRGFERRHAYVDGDRVEEFLFGQRDPRQLYHRILLFPKTLEAGRAPAQLAATRTKTELRSWKDLNPEMAVVLEFHDGMIRFFFLIIGITIVVTILTPVVMLWQERGGELKMMSTIGVSSRKIWQLGLYEAGLMSFLSGTTAALVLTVVIGIQSRVGMNFKSLSQGQVIERAGIELPHTIYPVLLPQQLAVAYLFVIFIIFLSYAWAVRTVLRRFTGEKAAL